MGYTHYWRNPAGITVDQWALIKGDAQKVIALSFPAVIQLDYEDPSPPRIDDDVIDFNGIGDDGHEPIEFKRMAHAFSFCKTANKPYDATVCAVLTIAKKHAPSLQVSSDGAWEWWQPGIDLARRAGVDLTENDLAALGESIRRHD